EIFILAVGYFEACSLLNNSRNETLQHTNKLAASGCKPPLRALGPAQQTANARLPVVGALGALSLRYGRKLRVAAGGPPRSLRRWPGQLLAARPGAQRRAVPSYRGEFAGQQRKALPRPRWPQHLFPPQSAQPRRAVRGARVGRRVPPLRERPPEAGFTH
nr:hypothetical protein [Tanacetum cinerariifolium]